MTKLYFVTNSRNKFEELEKIVKADRINLARYPLKIFELQTGDAEVLVKRKAFDAFKQIRRPLIVEHTMLQIDAFNQLPGPQTNYFYSQLGYQYIVEICEARRQFGANAESVFCYCDGKKYVIARAAEKGKIKRNDGLVGEAFEWDRIFCPESDNIGKESYAEMKHKKNTRSMRMKAWNKLKEKLGEEVLEIYRLPVEGETPARIEDQEDFKELADLIREKKVMLFIGAGISRSVDMPLWDELLKKLIGNEYDQELFKTYGDNMMLAEFIQQKKSKEELCQEMEKIFAIDGERRNKLCSSSVYKAIMELDCPVIYTTNFDHLIEEYYRWKKGEESYDKVVGIEDMHNLREGVTRIMKFHGEILDIGSKRGSENPIVLTESEYFGRMDFQNFMDIQLQADMLRYHILFLGYSLSDINIKMLLYMARKRQKADSAMKSFIFTVTPNQIQEAVFRENKIITLCGEDADKAKGTQEFLESLSALVNRK